MTNLPVDRDRLKKQFPELTDADLQAYETVTQRILGNRNPMERAKVTRAVLETGRAAKAKAETGGMLTEDERQALSYLDAVGKMQGTTVRRT